MSLQGQGHSRLVTGLKVVLPLAALAVLATLFLFPREIDPTRALPYASVDVEELTRDPRIGTPRFATVTEDGTSMTVTARTVRISPDGAQEWMTAESITVLMESATSDRNTMKAEMARLDRAAGLLVLDGSVRLDSAAGYQVETEHMIAALDRTRLQSDGPVIAIGPPGRLTAGAMLLQRTNAEAPDGQADLVLVFTDGVNLLYQPEAQE
jgi:lipopolysaccharide export system protein LptC